MGREEKQHPILGLKGSTGEQERLSVLMAQGIDTQSLNFWRQQDK